MRYFIGFKFIELFICGGKQEINILLAASDTDLTIFQELIIRNVYPTAVMFAVTLAACFSPESKIVFKIVVIVSL